MELLIVFLIVAVAGWYVVKTLYKSTQKSDGCDCGCTSCPSSTQCDGEIKELTKSE